MHRHVTRALLNLGWPLLAAATPALGQCEPRLDTPEAGPLDRIGVATALSTGVALVGAPWDGTQLPKAGAVRVYRRAAMQWYPATTLYASDPGVNDQFGTSVALDGTTAVIGTPLEDEAGSAAGAVYVFEAQGGILVEVAKLLASDAQPGDEFGFALALEGERLLVGARYGDAPGVPDAGAAYVFERVGGTWQEVAKLHAGDPGAIDYFGKSVALSGEVALVGAFGDDDLGSGTGSAYVFRGSAGWVQEQKLMAADAEPIDYFGFAVAAQGDTLAVSATGWDGNASDEGAIYVYRYAAGSWHQVQRLKGQEEGAQLGSAVALSGERLLASSVRGDGRMADSGVARVFLDQGGSFSTAERLVAYDGETDDHFGGALALDGDFALIGAEGEELHGPWAGAAYAFDLPFTDLDVDGIPDSCKVGLGFCWCGQTSSCDNLSSTGGCANSTGRGALLEATGSTRVATDDLVLVASELPASGFGLVFMGPWPLPPAPLADGLLCISSPIFRFPARAIAGGGTLTEGPGLVAHTHANFPSGGWITAGQTWLFQTWYRDPKGPCGQGSNTTNGRAILFLP